MLIPDLNNTNGFLIATFVLFFIITGRYFLIAGLFYSVFYLWYPEKWQKRKITARKYNEGQFKKEIMWSIVTSLLFAVAGSVTVLLWQSGYTKIYSNLGEYGWWYLPFSLLFFMLLHETYYYWLHRWMHHPAIFKIVHKVHHDSNITSPFTAFSFHPLEGLLQAVFLPVMLMIFPMHYFVIIVQLTLMTFSSVINHLEIEVYPAGFNNNFLGRWLIGATHHSLHHKQFKYNFGLYFTFWDKLKQTESPLYHSSFDKITQPSSQPGTSSAKNPLTS
ncbi:sterol desaturase family protein [soil metagenome]